MLLSGGASTNQQTRRQTANLIGGGINSQIIARKAGQQIWLFLSSSRTERALRFVAPLPFLVYLTYNENVIGTNFGYLMLVMYTIIAALMPPSFSAATLIWFMAVPAVCISLGLITLIWSINSLVATGQLSDFNCDVIVLCIIAFFFLLFANFKVGSLGSLLGIGFFATVYATQLVLIETNRLIRHGASLHVNITHAATIKAVIEALLPLLPPSVAAMVTVLIASIVQAAQTHQPISLTIPDQIRLLDRSFRHAVGQTIDIRFLSNDEMTIQIPGGWYLARICWEAKGRYGLIYGAVVHTLIAVGFWHLTTIIPPIRFMGTVLQNGFVMITDRLQKQIREFAEDIGAIEADDFEVPDEQEIEIELNITSDRDADTIVRLKGSEYHGRNFLDVTQTALMKLKGPMLLSAGDQLFTHPFGVNTILLQPRHMMELRISAFLIFFVTHQWRMMQLAFESKEGGACQVFMEGLEYGNQTFMQACCQWTQNSLDLLRITLVALAIQPRVQGAAFDLLLEVVKRELLSKMEISDKARHDVCTGWPQAIIEQLQTGTNCGNESDAWKRSFAMWCTLFLDGIVTKPYRIAQIALAQVQAYEKRTLKSAGMSLGSLFAPTLVLFYGLFKPSLDAWAYVRHKCVSRYRKPQVTILSQLQLDDPPSIRRPRESLLRRNSTAKLLFLTSTESSQFIAKQRESDLNQPMSPSGLCTLATMNDNKEEESPLQITSADQLSLDIETEQRHGHDNFWYILRLGFGATLLFALALVNYNWRRLTFLESEQNSSFVDLLGTKVAPWGCLGFLTTISLTVQATTKRAFLRMAGVIMGSFSGFVALSIASNSAVFHAFWLIFFDFIAVWLGAHPQMPSIGFHPSWGYAAQLFTYQQTIIIVEGRGSNGHEIVLARLVGQGTGIGLALLISLLFFPARANRCIRGHLASALWCLSESIAAVAEMILADGGDTLANQDRIASLRRHWSSYQVAQYKQGRQHITRARDIENENEIFGEAPAWLQTDPILSQLIGGLDRCLAFVEGVRIYTQREHRGNEDKQQIRMEQDTDDIQVERKFKKVLSEVINDLSTISALLRVTLNHGNRWHWPWQSSKLPRTFNRDSFLGTMELASAISLRRLGQLASTLSLSELKVGSEGDVSPERLFMDRRSIYWTYVSMYISELNWMGGQIALLLAS